MTRLLVALVLWLGLSGAALAADPVAEAVAAMGGPALEQVRTLQLTGRMTPYDPEQSAEPGGEPMNGGEGRFVQVRDLVSGQARTEWDMKALRPYPHSHAYVEIVDDEVGYVKGVDSFLATKRAKETGEHRMSTMRLIAVRRELERTSPRLLLEMQAHPERVTRLADERIDGRRHPAVRYQSGAATFTVLFDPATGLPHRIRTLDFDPVMGDLPFELTLSDWRPVGAVRLPFSQVYRIGGGLVSDIKVEAAAINPSAAPDAFAIPAGIRAVPAGVPPEAIPYQWILRKQGFHVLLDSDTVGTDPDGPPLVISDLAPGVSFLNGGGYNTLIVELKDYLVVYDAPIELQSQWLLARLKETHPGKAVRYVVLSHRHFDHAGGLRSYVAQGATVVVGPGGGAHLRKALARPATLAGVPLPAKLKPNVVEVTGRWSVSDGERSVEAYTFANGHAEDLMLGYVPHARIGFVSDIWAPGREPIKAPLGPGLRAVYDGVSQWGLKPERFAGGHGAVGPYAPLAEAAKK
jgi:glyoxylase-like metal-dependent hydrolase (beta-lactamase superfamily II)